MLKKAFMAGVIALVCSLNNCSMIAVSPAVDTRSDIASAVASPKVSEYLFLPPS